MFFINHVVNIIANLKEIPCNTEHLERKRELCDVFNTVAWLPGLLSCMPISLVTDLADISLEILPLYFLPSHGDKGLPFAGTYEIPGGVVTPGVHIFLVCPHAGHHFSSVAAPTRAGTGCQLCRSFPAGRATGGGIDLRTYGEGHRPACPFFHQRGPAVLLLPHL